MPIMAQPSSSEWATLFPSPTYATTIPASLPFCLSIVSKSARIWHGWCESVRPLITGIAAWRAHSSNRSWPKVRMTNASRYRDSTRAVSATVSPRPSWISCAGKNTGWPPSWAIATSNDTRVRVEAFSKNRPTLLPANAREGVRVLARSIKDRISCADKLRSDSRSRSAIAGGRSQRGVNDADRLIHFLLRHDQRRHQPDDRVRSRNHQQSPLNTRQRYGTGRNRQREPHQQAEPPDFFDRGVARREGAQAVDQPFPHAAAILQQVTVLEQGLQRGERRGARERVAALGRTVRPRRKGRRDPVRRQHRADGHSVGQPLGQGDPPGPQPRSMSRLLESSRRPATSPRTSSALTHECWPMSSPYASRRIWRMSGESNS